MKIGDKVKLSNLGDKNLALIPRNLVKKGELENNFTIVDIRDYDFGTYLALQECCKNIGRCSGHPIENFEVI